MAPSGYDDPAAKNWHVDRRIPLALIVTIAVQTFAAAWFVSQLDSRVANLERQFERQLGQDARIIRLEVGQEQIKARIGELKEQLEKR